MLEKVCFQKFRRNPSSFFGCYQFLFGDQIEENFWLGPGESSANYRCFGSIEGIGYIHISEEMSLMNADFHLGVF